MTTSNRGRALLTGACTAVLILTTQPAIADTSTQSTSGGPGHGGSVPAAAHDTNPGTNGPGGSPGMGG